MWGTDIFLLKNSSSSRQSRSLVPTQEASFALSLNTNTKIRTNVDFFAIIGRHMEKSFLTKIVLSFFVIALAFEGFTTTVSAQTTCPELEVLKTLTENELKEALLVCEKEANALQEVIAKTGKEKATLSNDISGLNAKIKQAKLAIRVRTLSIDGLVYDIKVKNSTISKLSAKINRQRDSLAQLIRKTDEIDSYSFAEVALSDKKISEFFGDLDSFEYIVDAIGVSLVEIDVIKKTNEEQKVVLEDKKTKEADLRYKQELEKKLTESNEAEKQRILKVTKGKEVVYQKDLKEKQKKASQIRAALFKLRDTAAIPFGTALEYANFASAKTGVRPALILALLQQESNMGANVGTCNRQQDPPSKNWKVIMPGPLHYQNYKKNGDSCKGADSPCSYRDDQAAFLRVTSELGISTEGTPLSCPWGNGWGGAMGPSQFIPTTWELLKSKIAEALNIGIPNPWEPKHAIVATAIYLSDRGADSGGYTAEWNAACKYYSGRKCDNNKKNPNTFYGNEVLVKAEVIQSNIDFLNGR